MWRRAENHTQRTVHFLPFLKRTEERPVLEEIITPSSVYSDHMAPLGTMERKNGTMMDNKVNMRLHQVVMECLRELPFSYPATWCDRIASCRCIPFFDMGMQKPD